MYWPIGAPRVYEQQLPIKQAQISEDGYNRSASRRRDRRQGSSTTGTATFARASQDQTKVEQEVGDESTESALDRPPSASTNIADNGAIIGLRVSRSGHLFATITKTTLTVWQTKPTVILASIVRSSQSLKSYGANVDLLLRPDADIVVVQTANAYLITYSVAGDPEGRAYALAFSDGGKRTRRRSSHAETRYTSSSRGTLFDGGGLSRDASLQFRMVIKLDAGISKALALDHELVVMTTNPAAVQCIRWSAERGGTQTSTELLSNMKWLEGNKTLSDFVYDRPMNLFAFVSNGGRAYAVQRLADKVKDPANPRALFDGHIFHTPSSNDDAAVKAAINSRFSLIALGCENGAVVLYSVRDYAGGVSLLRRLNLSVSSSSSGKMTALQFSPDGYCLFAGYERGWMTWSVYGQPGGTSFGCDRALCESNGDGWLTSVSDALWIGGGSDIIITEARKNKIWFLEFARSAVTGCFNPANVTKGLLQTSSGLVTYQGDQTPDLTTIAADSTLWQHVEVPAPYLLDQWPLRSAVISPDGRYIAIAGQRGLAHYSLQSSRWRTFTDLDEQNDFAVRGGMCWHHHFLIVAVETSSLSRELRIYSRESPLENSHILHTTSLTAPVVYLAVSNGNSLLVYNYDNSLDHYIITASKKTVQLAKVGQIALHGIIRAPPRVRAVSWVVPDHQLEDGDVSQDVATASVFFLVDGKLVLLQPSATDGGELKYDMRVIAHHVEYFILARDIPATSSLDDSKRDEVGSFNDLTVEDRSDHSLKDSLWVFDGQAVRLWPDVKDFITAAADDPNRDLDTSISIPVDFYPLSALLQKGIIMGTESELIQRRDAHFSHFRTVARTTLFIPSILRHHLSQFDSPAAMHLSHHFQQLTYFSHALEVLLHNVLDEEVERGSDKESSLLPTTLSFLSMFPEYMDIIVQCTRKTELRSWRTLFAHLPPPVELFEASLQRGSLKTAGGYLLVLHTLADMNSTSPQVVRLLRAAKAAEDWELCKELARFLIALDESGDTLREALELVDVPSPSNTRGPLVLDTSPFQNGGSPGANGNSTGPGDGSDAAAAT